jgi:hypothetical protein
MLTVLERRTKFCNKTWEIELLKIEEIAMEIGAEKGKLRTMSLAMLGCIVPYSMGGRSVPVFLITRHLCRCQC